MPKIMKVENLYKAPTATNNSVILKKGELCTTFLERGRKVLHFGVVGIGSLYILQFSHCRAKQPHHFQYGQNLTTSPKIRSGISTATDERHPKDETSPSKLNDNYVERKFQFFPFDCRKLYLNHRSDFNITSKHSEILLNNDLGLEIYTTNT